MKHIDHAKAGMEIIDTFFAEEQKLTEEDRLRYGLAHGVEHGYLSSVEADECMRAFLSTRYEQPTNEI